MTIERSVFQIFPHLIMPNTFWKTVSKVGQILLRLCKWTAGSEELETVESGAICFKPCPFSRIRSCMTLWSCPFMSRMQVHTTERGGVLKTCLSFNLSVRTTPNISLVLTNKSSTISHFMILWWCRHAPRTLSEYWTQSLLYWLCGLGLCSWINRTLPSFIQQLFIERVNNVETDVKWKMRQPAHSSRKIQMFQNIVCNEENKTNLGSFLLKKALREGAIKATEEKRSQLGNALARSPHSLRAQGCSVR